MARGQSLAGALARRLPDGRLHLQHGPIDMLCWARGADVDAAFGAATAAFAPMLDALVGERAALRCVGASANGPVARRMARAVAPFAALQVTPMAAVAGAGADHILAAMLAAAPLSAAWVNNGGDIAVHVAAGDGLRVGLVHDLATGLADEAVTIAHGSGVGGIATSGWPGRSFSLGIADAVTVLAVDAAAADAAATVIANAVNVDDPAIVRKPARTIDPDSDLRDRLVTVDVPKLPNALVVEALERGTACAAHLASRDLIIAAFMKCQDVRQSIGDLNAQFRCVK